MKKKRKKIFYIYNFAPQELQKFSLPFTWAPHSAQKRESSFDDFCAAGDVCGCAEGLE